MVSGEERKLKVVTTIFPLYDFARNIGNGSCEVTLLLPPGVEAHSFEPKPTDMARIDNADIFIYTGKSMEPWVGRILKGISNKSLLVIEAGQGISLINNDPHIWLDLSYAQVMVDNILAGFIQKDPADKELYNMAAGGYKARLAALDSRFKTGLAHCRQNTFMHGGHFAFGYLARRYNLKFISAYKGLNSESEPSPKVLAALSDEMKKNNIRIMYYEELASPRTAKVIAQETGAKLLLLNSGHNLTKEQMRKKVTFLSMMEQDLGNLKIGLQCQ